MGTGRLYFGLAQKVCYACQWLFRGMIKGRWKETYKVKFSPESVESRFQLQLQYVCRLLRSPSRRMRRCRWRPQAVVECLAHSLRMFGGAFDFSDVILVIFRRSVRQSKLTNNVLVPFGTLPLALTGFTALGFCGSRISSSCRLACPGQVKLR